MLARAQSERHDADCSGLVRAVEDDAGVAGVQVRNIMRLAESVGTNFFGSWPIRQVPVTWRLQPGTFGESPEPSTTPPVARSKSAQTCFECSHILREAIVEKSVTVIRVVGKDSTRNQKRRKKEHGQRAFGGRTNHERAAQACNELLSGGLPRFTPLSLQKYER